MVTEHIQENPNFFTGVGIQSQDCGEQLIIQDMPDPKCHQIPSDQLRYDGLFSHFINSSHPGNYQTFASLNNVRKIQASTGMRGRSRSPNGISGLKIEYYNHPTPNIVGQWMDELDDDFELSPDEEVQLVTIWITPMGFSSATPGLEVGQVAAIHIETTHSRSVTFRSPGFHTLPSRKLQHQYQSSSGEKLTALSWVLNVDSDIIRAVISPNGSRKGQILVPQMDPPFDLVQKLYFETQNSNGDIETIVTARAYFLERAIVGLEFIYTSGSRARIGGF